MLDYLQGPQDFEIESLGARKAKKSSGGGGGKKKLFPKLKKKVAVIGLAPARAAFLSAVSLNFLHLASKLSAAMAKDQNKTLSFWTKLGGQANVLINAVNTGKNRKGVLHGEPDNEAVGVVAIATIAATATPIIIAAVKLMKEMGVNTPGATPSDEAAIDQNTNNFVADAKETLSNDETVTKGTATLPSNVTAAKISNKGSQAPASNEDGGDQSAAKSTFGGLTSPRTYLKALLLLMVLSTQLHNKLIIHPLTIVFTALFIATLIFSFKNKNQKQ